MKKYYSIIIVSMSFILIASTLAFYYSYTKNVILDKEDKEMQVTDNKKEKNKDSDGMYVSSDDMGNITSKTLYEIIIEDRQAGTITTSNENLPVDIIGLDRQETINYYKEFLDNPSLEEINEGLISCELVSFSSKKIVVKKVYDKKIAKDKFFIIEEGGFVTVYYQDKKSVFEYTRISVNYFNKDEIEKLKEGFYVENEEKLYSILESYSS